MNRITLADIDRGLRSGIEDFATTLPPERVVLSGARVGTSLPSGLCINLQDTFVEASFETRLIRPANVALHLMLEGSVSAWLDGAPLTFGRAPGRPPQIVFSALDRPAAFHRRFEHGQHLRKVTVLVSWDWLAERGISRQAFMQGGPRRDDRWPALPQDIADAEALLAGGAENGALQIFEREAFAMRLVSRAMARLAPGQTGLRGHERDKLARMEALAARPGPLPALAEIAAAGGVSQSTMRRLFRRAHGAPVLTRLRALRMERAAEALDTGATVAEAARLAGYESAPAFATAFRQTMGTSPSRYAGTRRGSLA